MTGGNVERESVGLSRFIRRDVMCSSRKSDLRLRQVPCTHVDSLRHCRRLHQAPARHRHDGGRQGLRRRSGRQSAAGVIRAHQDHQSAAERHKDPSEPGRAHENTQESIKAWQE
jgi:hypothetical protein